MATCAHRRFKRIRSRAARQAIAASKCYQRGTYRFAARYLFGIVVAFVAVRYSNKISEVVHVLTYLFTYDGDDHLRYC